MQPFAEELVRLKVEIIVTNGTIATVAAKNATTSIPIVMSSSGDPVRAGLVASLARPGGNVTGFSLMLPELIVEGRELLEAGGVLSYDVSERERTRRVAALLDKILRGAKPADLPIEQPTKFELVINLKTAKALGITVPQTLLLRADEVIQ